MLKDLYINDVTQKGERRLPFFDTMYEDLTEKVKHATEGIRILKLKDMRHLGPIRNFN